MPPARVHRAVGFFSPEDLISTFMMAGRWSLDTEPIPKAQAIFDEALRDYPNHDAAAEALFFLGVSQYKMSHDPKPLRATYEKLTAKFPDSTWTKQADHYGLIPK